jgi:hypothetical protein
LHRFATDAGEKQKRPPVVVKRRGLNLILGHDVRNEHSAPRMVRGPEFSVKIAGPKRRAELRSGVVVGRTCQFCRKGIAIG